MLFILGLAFGIDNYIFTFLPLEMVRSLPLSAVIAVIAFLKSQNLRALFLNQHMLIGLLAYGLLVALIRFFLFYSTDFEFTPILRQGCAFLLGITFFTLMSDLAQKYSLNITTRILSITSVPFLVIGLIQKLMGQQVANYSRVTGLFSEPSYFGDYLVFIVIPASVAQLTFFFREPKSNDKLTAAIVLSLALVNIIFLQSGTTLLKLVTLTSCFVVLFPIGIRSKALIVGSICLLVSSTFLMENSYVALHLKYALRVFHQPSSFLGIGSFYDRFYPIYSALLHLPRPAGVLGLGFGGDYFEFTNLYPLNVQPEMIAMKPSLSFFNSFTAKVILYFGIIGIGYLLYLCKLCFQSKNSLLKTMFSFLLITSLWGTANFALPYVWFWMAYLQAERKVND